MNTLVGPSLVALRAKALAAAIWLSVGWWILSGCAASAQTAGRVMQVVHQYALTSANDFPQRDPADWRLLGSNDDGKTWTILDLRKRELFTERHQRRVFQLTNAAPFNLYRLQIDRVRDPEAADCVQLAELEPLGATDDDQDPVPLEEDSLATQGDNPPLETIAQAFDGQRETKWLDHASQNLTTRASWIQWQYLPHTGLVITNIQRLLELRSRAKQGYTVHIEGVAAGYLPDTHTLCLLDATGTCEIPVRANAVRFHPGQRLCWEGQTQWTNHQVIVRASTLRASGPEPGPEPQRIELEEILAQDSDWHWVEVEGQIQFRTRTEHGWRFELEDTGRHLEVQIIQAAREAPPASGRVRVRGVCESLWNGRGERVAGRLWMPSLTELQPLTPSNPSANSSPGSGPIAAPAELPQLTRVEQIRRLSPEELTRGPRVKLRGTVTELFGAFLQDETGGVEVWWRGEVSRRPPNFGMCIEIEGRADWGIGHGPIVRAEKLHLLGAGKLPAPERCSWSQLASGKLVSQWVEIEAVTRATDGSHLLLTCEGGQLMATIRSAPAMRVKQLVDATVRVRGVSVAATDSRGRVQGIQLIVPSLEYVEIEQAAPDPFSLPARTIGSLLQVRGPNEFIHRVKVEGVLTFRDGRNYFLQDDTGGALAIAQEEVVLNIPAGGWSWMFWQSPIAGSAPELSPFQVGDRLQVVGFPESRGYSPVLTEVLARKVGRAGSVAPVAVTVPDIIKGGLDSTLVTLQATLLRQEVVRSLCVLELQSEQRVFQALIPVSAGFRQALVPGSRIRITGVCQIEPLPYAELGNRVGSFKLLVESPAQLSVLERPSWWTLKRALSAAGALLVVLAAAVAWISILRRQVEERTRQLQQAVSEHEKTEARLAREKELVQAEIQERKRIEAEVERTHKQLLQTSRLAGMAEVATSVLHNVGNVLNSANVLASSIGEQVQRSKLPSLTRLAALLGEHRTNLDRFLAEDSRGQQLPGYVERLAAHLTTEHARLLEKVRALTESIHHIKEIVAMQQNYAKVSGVLETGPLTEVVEDALRIHEAALARHGIRVVRDFAETPPATIDRHKVLQILFNLLENAKHACTASDQPEKVVTVRLQPLGPDRLQVQVNDNGIGIPPENLPRLFVQEFTTRKGGHGFGLHSSILTAQDMGGTLTATSEGTSRGATFTLELPVTAKPANSLPPARLGLQSP